MRALCQPEHLHVSSSSGWFHSQVPEYLHIVRRNDTITVPVKQSRDDAQHSWVKPSGGFPWHAFAHPQGARTATEGHTREEGDTKGRTAGREENARGRNKNAMFDMVIYPLGGDLS